MPDIKVMDNFGQNFFHMAGNGHMSIGDKRCYEETIAK